MSLSRRMVCAARGLTMDHLPPEVIAKVKIGLLDFLSCAFEARDLPWGCQAIRMASAATGQATVIGTPVKTSPAEAAFANATLGHGLVREDMHTGAVSHLGVVIFPTLLALAQRQRASGRDFILGAVCGYEIGASVGRAIMDQEMVLRFRPTGITGPLAGAIAGLSLLFLAPTLLPIGSEQTAAGMGLLAWAIMTILYLPMVNFYEIPLLWAFMLPAAAVLYMVATIDSARLYWQNKGGQWKGRVQG